MTARAYLSDEKIGPPPNAAVFKLVSNVSCEKNPAKNPIDRVGSPPFSRIFNRCQSLLAAVTLTAFHSRGSLPSGPLRRSMGETHARLGPFLSQRAYSPDVFVFQKTRILRPNFSLLIEMIGSQVVVSMFTHCSRRPPILNLLGCHARFDLPECQQDLEIAVRKSSSMGDVLVVVVCDVIQSP